MYIPVRQGLPIVVRKRSDPEPINPNETAADRAFRNGYVKASRTEQIVKYRALEPA
jgi:hypothetical protein